MNGAESLVAAAVASGIEICLANPGTTELPLVNAMDSVPGLRGILCLHENVATGAADGYARMAGKPALCLLHHGPGLANGLSNLHNARRAFTPMISVVGEHATWHRDADPLLASDIAKLAEVESGRVITCGDVNAIADEMTAAIAFAQDGHTVTLILPHDLQLASVTDAQASVQNRPPRSFSAERVEAAAKALRTQKTALLLGSDALTREGLHLAGRIAAATDSDLICDTFFRRMERGAGSPAISRLPYFPDQAIEMTKAYEHVVIVGTRRPVGFFGYSGIPSHLTTAEQTVLLTGPHEDTPGALLALVQSLNAADEIRPDEGALPEPQTGTLDAESVSKTIARMQPENAILMDEALSVGTPYFEASKHAPRFSHLMLTGGSIGQGPSSATGAAIACPDRKVINYQSDGCGAYSVQAFWTQARERLDVVTIIAANQSYNILNVELQRAGVNAPGPVAQKMAALDDPALSWTNIGEGMGVPSTRVDTVKELEAAIDNALSQEGPHLIEAIMT
ncbi:MAG: acetolactate synthase large subunit [Filomicrobium sp.]